MRLLDLIAQAVDPVLVLSSVHGRTPVSLSGPREFAQRVSACPLRFVMADNLTRASAELAFADGVRLSDCLDLIRIPAPDLWIEWSDSAHQQVMCESGAVAPEDMDTSERQIGVLLQAAPSGRSAVVRTFWSAHDGAGGRSAEMSPVETYFNLDDRFVPSADGGDLLRGECVSVPSCLPHIADLLERVRFRFDQSWANYYKQVALDRSTRETVVRKSLGAVAHDIPLLLAFFLLLNAKGATRAVEINRQYVNQKRQSRDRRLLLDHVEVHATLPEAATAQGTFRDESNAGTRHSPRLHHVRGHLVRREDRIFWRVPHLRGCVHRGVIRSRTVCLQFSSA